MIYKLSELSLFLLLILFLASCQKEEPNFQPLPSNARFIDTYLIEQGWLQTDLSENKNVYLSESIGLWMQYLLKIGDQQRFEEQVKILTNHFITDDSLISWRYSDGQASRTNALIDDFRIMAALNKAGEMWDKKKYKNLAKAIGKSIVAFQLKDGTFIDFYDGTSSNDVLTLSYLDPGAILFLQQEKLLTAEQATVNLNLLKEIPMQSGLYAQRFYPLEHRFEYDREVNLIDQYYIAYHRILAGIPIEEIISFTKQMLTEHGKLYGRIDAESKQFTVDYESPAVYALAYMAMERAGEQKLAQQLLLNMEQLKVNDSKSEYFGGYIDMSTRQTHFFDNILPLLAEAGTGNEK
ncbi:glycosyl hydrolase family 8 [Solibacillus silvestris]|uniref:glycosyl hydrolase family 8 n=1 Tax=Solibacillus silvestris TaxID=76853 RepID=UPI003F7D6625